METSLDGILFKSVDSAYTAAHNSAILVDRSEYGLLKFSGKSRLDLINRMSTQKVIGLKDFEGAATILTTDIGRIIDRLILYEDGSDAYCLTSENNGDAIATYLRRFVFYMDDFHIEDLAPSTTILGIYGNRARTLLSEVVGEPIDLPLHHWQLLDFEGTYLALHRTDPIAGDGFFLMSRMANISFFVNRLIDVGITPAGENAYDYLRIESGRPRFGHELTGDYIPLEANLWGDVSFNKGCYTGQEIIARMESRGRIAKKMVLLRGNQPVEARQTLLAGGKKAGTLTSIAPGPEGYLALGFVKTSLLGDDPSSGGATTLTAGDASYEIVTIF